MDGEALPQTLSETYQVDVPVHELGSLCLTRKAGQKIVFGDPPFMEIEVCRIMPGGTRLAIRAPKSLLIRRNELLEEQEEPADVGR